MFEVGQFYTRPGVPGVVKFKGPHFGGGNEYLSFEAGSKKVINVLAGHTSLLSTKQASDDEVAQFKVSTWIEKYAHSVQLKVYLDWLRDAGTDGVVNDCGCTKDEYYNYTCHCRTLVKLYHRFSVFKDDLVNKLGYKIEDVEMDNGKHKTVLVSEPYKRTEIN